MYEDIYKRAREIRDPVKRARFINRNILLRYEGFWGYWWANLLNAIGLKSRS